MRRIAVLGSSLGLLLSVAVVSSARAAQPSSRTLAPTAAVAATRGPVVPLSRLLHLAPLRELGLAGVNLRLQLPALVAPYNPYLETRLGDGVSGSRPDGALLIPGTSIGLGGALGDRGAGLMFARGVDLGVDVHRWRAGYVSVAVGWLRSTVLVGGFDAHDRFVANNVSLDGMMFKVGVSF